MQEKPPVVRSRLALISVASACLALAACNNDVAPQTSAQTAAAVPASTSASSVALSGSPATTATAGSTYIFQPSLTAGSGDVTFSVTGLPAWASFDTNTGVLTGKPMAADVGKTGSITITASNGASNASVGPFVIQIDAPPTTSVTLAWDPPTVNTDGTPITGLSGFHIYYGIAAGSKTTIVNVSSPSMTTAVISGLSHGTTYYFSVVAYNAAGEDSPDSNTASTSI